MPVDMSRMCDQGRGECHGNMNAAWGNAFRVMREAWVESIQSKRGVEGGSEGLRHAFTVIPTMCVKGDNTQRANLLVSGCAMSLYGHVQLSKDQHRPVCLRPIVVLHMNI